jgi:hypothetical protein
VNELSISVENYIYLKMKPVMPFSFLADADRETPDADRNGAPMPDPNLDIWQKRLVQIPTAEELREAARRLAELSRLLADPPTAPCNPQPRPTTSITPDTYLAVSEKETIQ